MDNYRAIAQGILNQVTGCLSTADPQTFARLAQALAGQRAIFVAGEGRAEAVGRAFASALARLGRDVHVVGESTATGIGSGDLLFALSPGGASPVTAGRLDLARRVKATTVVITGDANAPILEKADLAVVLLPGTRTPYSDSPGAGAYLLFAQALMVYLDALVIALAQATGRNSFSVPGIPLD